MTVTVRPETRSFEILLAPWQAAHIRGRLLGRKNRGMSLTGFLSESSYRRETFWLTLQGIMAAAPHKHRANGLPRVLDIATGRGARLVDEPGIKEGTYIRVVERRRSLGAHITALFGGTRRDRIVAEYMIPAGEPNQFSTLASEPGFRDDELEYLPEEK